jgi:hypothetical protein
MILGERSDGIPDSGFGLIIGDFFDQKGSVNHSCDAGVGR